MWDVPPILGHSFPAPARSSPPHASPFPSAALLWVVLPSFCLVPFCVVVLRGLPVVALVCLVSCFCLVSFRFALFAVLLAPSRGHFMKPMRLVLHNGASHVFLIRYRIPYFEEVSHRHWCRDLIL